MSFYNALNSSAINLLPSARFGGGTLVRVNQELQAVGQVAVSYYPETVVDVNQAIEALGEAAIVITIRQEVGIGEGEGTIYSAQNNILVQIQGSGTIVSASQFIESVSSSGSVSVVRNRIRNGALEFSHLQRYGWDLIISVDGYEFDPENIMGTVEIEKTENNATIASFTVGNITGTQDLAEWHGKQITIDIEYPDRMERLFTGIVDYPTYDLIDKKILIDCTDNRTARLESMPQSWINQIGWYSEYLFQESATRYEQINNRLRTTPLNIFIDREGGIVRRSMIASGSANYTFNDEDILYRTPEVELSSKARIVNNYQFTFDWSFTRLREVNVNFRVSGWSFTEVMCQGGDRYWIDSASILSAANETGWGSGIWCSFNFRPVSSEFWCGTQKRYWINDSRETIDGRIFDPYCHGASWSGWKVFTQNCTYRVQLNVEADQSIAQYGNIVKKLQNGYTVPYETSPKEEYNEQLQIANGSSGNHRWYDYKGSVSEFNNAIQTGYGICSTEIRLSHRENYVSFDMLLRPELELGQKVSLETTPVNAFGVISKIIHTIDIGSKEINTKVDLAMSKAQGTATPSETTIASPTVPIVGLDTCPSSITFKTNQTDGNGNAITATQFKMPSIGGDARRAQTEEVTYTHKLQLTDNTLTVNF